MSLKEMKIVLSGIVIISMVAIIFSLANCELNYTPFSVSGPFVPTQGNC